MHISVNIFYRYILSRCAGSSGRARSPPRARVASCTRAPAGRRRGWRSPWTPAPWPGQLELSLMSLTFNEVVSISYIYNVAVSLVCASPSDYAVLPPRTLVPGTYVFTVTVSKGNLSSEASMEVGGTGTDISHYFIIIHQCYPGGDHHRQPAHHLAHRPAAQIQPRPGHHRQR